EVFPYCTDDLVTCQRLLDAGCRILMPWGAPIGSGQGLLNPTALRTLRARLPDAVLVVDAGIGSPQHAVHAMELGFDAVLVNSAVAQAQDPVKLARAVRPGVAVQGRGRMLREVGRTRLRDPADRACRWLECEVHGLHVVSVYLPNGNPVPSDNFDYKLRWMDRLVAHGETLMASGRPVILA